jgi:predicted transcriptional regulator
MPRFQVGRFLKCSMRGKVLVRGIHEALVQWPYTLRNGGGQPLLILCGDLARAVRRESEIAVAHWWGASQTTVWKWRKELGVEATNKGTSALRARWAPESCQSDNANARRMPTLKSPERAAKIAAAKRGKPRPQHVIDSMRRKPSAETRQKYREAAIRRGACPPAAGRPFTPEEDALLGTAKDREIAKKLDRDLQTIQKRRNRLGIPAFAKRRIAWTATLDKKLGKVTDEMLALKIGCSVSAVTYRRRLLKVAACGRVFGR